jgi:hypothetical protein
METFDRTEQLAVEKYKLLLELWMSENPVKTSKLEMLLAINSILVSAFFLANRTVWIALAGFFFSAIWVLSIGRTVSFQQHWRSQMEDLRREHSDNPLFQIHSVEIKPSIWGRVPSRYYLLGTPIALSIVWAAVVVYVLMF